MKFTFGTGKAAAEFVFNAMDLCDKNGFISLFQVKHLVSLYTQHVLPKDFTLGWTPGMFHASAEVIDTDGLSEVSLNEPEKLTGDDLKRSVNSVYGANWCECKYHPKTDSHVINYAANDVAVTAALYEQVMSNKPEPGENVIKDDNVNHPNHYQSEGGLETIDVIKEFTKCLDGVEAFAIGNALKYICRFDKKNGVEDLKKAQWYLDYVVKYRESGRKNHDAMVDSIVGLMNVKLDKDAYLDIGEGAEVELSISREMFEEALEKLNDSGDTYITGRIIPSVTDPGKLMSVSIICPIVHDPFIRAAVNNTLMIYGGDLDGDFVFYGGKAYYVNVNDGLVVRRGDIPNRNGGYTGRYILDTEEATA